jgi:D-alanyl-D-alanine carboxypeptidase/D-alanyl-D-alanine-endopeptidase (penicillin-binding protein 4)
MSSAVVAAVVAATLVGVAACAGDPSAVGSAANASSATATVGGPASPPSPAVTDSTATGPAPFAPTTRAAATPQAVSPADCVSAESTPATDVTSTTPPEVTAALAGPVADRRFAGDTLSVSVWIDGWGEVMAVDPDRALVPASNQKLLVISAAVTVLDPSAHPRTSVVASGPTLDGVVQGDLVLVGGGDPDLTTTGPDSLDALAQLVHDHGITSVTGRALIDESRYDDQRTVASWPAGTNDEAGAGGLGALMVDRNRGPGGVIAMRNATLFRDALRAHGVGVAGPPGAGPAVAGVEVAGLDGPSYAQLMGQMLQLSDGLVAESMVKEIGWRQRGDGSTAAGLAAIRDELGPLCVALDGTDHDGSGFSYQDGRSAREWRRLLQAGQRQPWGPQLLAALPVAGRSGTLVRRLTGPATAGNVHAKTGSLSISKAMSGFLTTAGGRSATFSIVVNGPATGSAEPAIDALVTAIASLPG